MFNLIGPRLVAYGGGKPATQLSVDEFMAPLVRLVRSRFITSRAAARHMVEQRSGVILFVGPGRPDQRVVAHAPPPTCSSGPGSPPAATTANRARYVRHAKS